MGNSLAPILTFHFFASLKQRFLRLKPTINYTRSIDLHYMKAPQNNRTSLLNSRV